MSHEAIATIYFYGIDNPSLFIALTMISIFC